MFNPYEGWVRVSESTPRAIELRNAKREGAFQFGIDFLDDAMFGVFTGDLVLLGGQSGVGKTQLACNLALSAARQGKKVFYFALEAEVGEIEQRLLFQRLGLPGLSFGEYMTGLKSEELNEAERVALEKDPIAQSGGDILVFYKESNFGLKDLEREILSHQNSADVFILDHFHFLDHEYTKSEQEEHKRAIRLIRDTALSVKKPVILLAHLNKAHAKSTNPIPGMYDFYGTADLINVATKIITITGRVPEDCQVPLTTSGAELTPTVIQICKHRMDGAVTAYFAVAGFSPERGDYMPGYLLSKASEAKLLSRRDASFPRWAKRGKSYEQRPYSSLEKPWST